MTKFTRDGQYVKGVTLDPIHFYPGYLTFDANDNLYVIDLDFARSPNNQYEIHKLDSNLNVLGTLGSMGSGDGQFLHPTAIAVAPDGTILVNDRERDLVITYNADGTFRSDWPFSGYGFSDTRSRDEIRVDQEGFAYLIDKFSAEIVKFDLDGVVQARFCCIDPGSEGLVLASDGNIIIADTPNHRVQVLDASGSGLFNFDVRAPDTVIFGPEGNLWTSSSGADGLVLGRWQHQLFQVFLESDAQWRHRTPGVSGRGPGD